MIMSLIREGSTIEYLNECERIVNLKKLTEDSNNKAEKRVSRMKSEENIKKCVQRQEMKMMTSDLTCIKLTCSKKTVMLLEATI